MIQEYYIDFVQNCRACGVTPTVALVRMCIAISCADVAAGTNKRLTGESDTEYGIDTVPEMVYQGKDPWVAFGLNKTYLKIAEHLTNYIASKLEC